MLYLGLKIYKMDVEGKLEQATLGGGCFWCLEAVFQNLIGVYSVVSGYSGGKVKNPSYREIGTGTTGHAEVTQITYDPTLISFADLLEIFWATHDPTTLNRQANDVGTQYRSVIYYHNQEQKQIAEQSKNEVAAALYNDPIVTEISEAVEFYIATDDHQDFYKRNPDYGYCRVIIDPKVNKLRQKFAHRLKK